jgi:hypothetical protein
MITVKSIHPKSLINKFTMEFQTTASVGPCYMMVPYDSILEYVNYGMAIKTTSNRSFSIENLTKSMSYLNSAVVMGSGAVGFVTKNGISSSDAGASGTYGRPIISAGTLLKIDWSSTKGDCAFNLVFKRDPNEAK